MLKTALFDCAINEKSCNVDGGRGISPLFSSPPKGIWQLKSSHPREFAIQGKQNDWCITSESLGTTLIVFAYIEWLLDMAADKTKPYTLQVLWNSNELDYSTILQRWTVAFVFSF